MKPTRVLYLITRNKQLLEAYEPESPKDKLSIRQYEKLHATYLTKLENLMKPFGLSVHYTATA